MQDGDRADCPAGAPSVRISIDLNVCDGYGRCAETAPDLFWLDDDDRVQWIAETSEDRRADAERAAKACPMTAITIE